MRVALGDRFPPESHRADCPIVIPMGEGSDVHGVSYPFAAIIALDPGEDISSKPRLCIYVWPSKKGGFLMGDGIFCPEGAAPMIWGATEFPELIKALKMPKPEWSPLLKTAPHSKPYALLKSWQQGDLDFSLTYGSSDPKHMNDALPGPSIALAAMTHWHRLKPLDWRERTCQCFPGIEKLALKYFDRLLDKFQSLLNKTGVSAAHKDEFAKKLESLTDSIKFAHRVCEHAKGDC